ncbi:MAG TPA: DUF2970 domain-containing protein [Pseudomonas sp.]
MSEQQPQRNDDQDESPLTFRQMLQSVLAAAFGVQSGKNRARDFSRGKPSHFILLGLLFTGVFILLLYSVVRLVLQLSGVK